MGNTGMNILKFENAPAPRKAVAKKSNLKTLAGLATVAAVAVLGSTLAANISLGSGASLEFGQGVQVTAACDSAITLSPKVTFVNSASNPQFFMSTVSFSDVDARTAGQGSTINGGTGCAGRTLTLNAYGDTLATPIAFASSSGSGISAATIGINASTPTTSAGFVVAGGANLGSATSSFDLGITTPNATSGAIYKLTLQSSN